MKPLRPGTVQHETAISKAIGDYLAGKSLEQAARANRVNHQTLRTRILRGGLTIRTDRHYPGITTINVDTELYERILSEHPRLTVREISSITGVSKTTVTKHLKKRGTYQPRKAGAQPEASWAVSLRNRTKVLKAVQLRNDGYTYGQIGLRLGVTRSTVGTWLRQYRQGSFKWQRERIPTEYWHETGR